MRPSTSQNNAAAYNIKEERVSDTNADDLAKRREEWQIPDPKEMPAEDYRAVRDLIEAKVRKLLAELA